MNRETIMFTGGRRQVKTGTWIEMVFQIQNNSTIIRVVLWRREFMSLGLITIPGMELCVRVLN